MGSGGRASGGGGNNQLAKLATLKPPGRAGPSRTGAVQLAGWAQQRVGEKAPYATRHGGLSLLSRRDGENDLLGCLR
eukprot:626748-Hanusia_phi.AAC.6